MSLPYRLRPQSLSEFVGQEHLVGEGKIIRKMIDDDQVSSIIFWGPPGSGKTTLAAIIAHATNSDFHSLSAVNAGKEDLKRIIEIARKNANPGSTQSFISSKQVLSESTKNEVINPAKKRRTILFIDEIHRWNKAQQDALLPYVESGLVTLIGATTENPSFEINSALLSRSRVFVLKSLDSTDLEMLIDRGLTDKERGLGEYKKIISKDAKELLVRLSGGDGRIMLNALEMAVTNYTDKKISTDLIKEVFQTKSAGIYDKKADEHYNIISAFIKSMRGSDVDASLYYLARMLENGEDPKFIARRMIIFASEDVGLADRGALIQANAGFEAVHKIGMPEAQLVLAHICVYLALAKKSRGVTNAIDKAKAAVYEYPNEPVPLHLRNAPTKLMKDLGYGKNYSWSDESVGPEKDLPFLPEKIKRKKFFDAS